MIPASGDSCVNNLCADCQQFWCQFINGSGCHHIKSKPKGFQLFLSFKLLHLKATAAGFLCSWAWEQVIIYSRDFLPFLECAVFPKGPFLPSLFPDSRLLSHPPSTDHSVVPKLCDRRSKAVDVEQSSRF